MNTSPSEHVYYCPWRDRIYIVDEYSHKLGQHYSVQVFDNENDDMFFCQELPWEYLGPL